MQVTTDHIATARAQWKLSEQAVGSEASRNCLGCKYSHPQSSGSRPQGLGIYMELCLNIPHDP